MKFLSQLFSRKLDPVVSALPTDDLTSNENASESEADPYKLLKAKASAFLDAGSYDKAEVAYQEALNLEPDQAEAHLNLGYVLLERGRVVQAKICLERTLAIDPSSFDGHFLYARLALAELDLKTAHLHANTARKLVPASTQARALLLQVLAGQGDFETIERMVSDEARLPHGGFDFHLEMASIYAGIPAVDLLRQSLSLRALHHLDQANQLEPGQVHIAFNRGRLFMAIGDTIRALESLDDARSLNPRHAEAFFYTGVIHRTTKNYDAARKYLEAAIELKPAAAEFQKVLGEVFYEQSMFKKAIACFRTALKLDPDLVDALVMMATALGEIGEAAAAVDNCKHAVELRPDSPEVHFAMANIYAHQNRYAKAIEFYEQAINLNADYVDARINLGAAFLGLSAFPEALAQFRRVLEIDPRNLIASTNIVYCSSFDDTCSSPEYLKRARHFGTIASGRAKPYTHWAPRDAASQVIKIGIVSGDLGTHPVGFFLESVLAYLDPEKIEIHAFSNGYFEGDALQTSLKSRMSSWISIRDLTDEQAAQLIHDKQLDLLIDLSGHTGKNRLPLFAWRPAPLQASWLGYWASTGVAEMDYVIADPYSVPVANQAQFSEQVHYLPHTRLCFTPPSTLYDLPVAPPPCLKTGHITFGSFQPIRKLTVNVLSVWGEIANRTPDARFRLQGSGFTDPTTSADLLRRLSLAGIAAERVQLCEGMPRSHYLRAHEEVDIILDTFPYPGGTTTCDALWMGVPTVTLAGTTMLSRQGVSMLTCAGLSAWIAEDVHEYVELATTMAMKPGQLALLRSSLRLQVFRSPLFDAPRFGRDFQQCIESLIEKSTASIDKAG